MTLAQKARIIRERRQLLATNKNMMGSGGKLGIIAKYLGTPIIRQGSGLMDQTFLTDPYDMFEEEDKLPTYNDAYQCMEGYIFDGLSRGMHFEVRLNIVVNEIRAQYQGYVVYEEKLGDLYAYNPQPEWEDNIVEPLYKQATKKAKELGAEIAEEKRATAIEKARLFLEDLKQRWGL